MMVSAAGYSIASVCNAYAHDDGSLNAWQWPGHHSQLQVTMIK